MKTKPQILYEIRAKRGAYTRKRTKKLLRLKHIRQNNKSKKKKKVVIPPPVKHTPPPPPDRAILPVKKSWWQRFWAFIKRLI